MPTQRLSRSFLAVLALAAALAGCHRAAAPPAVVAPEQLLPADTAVRVGVLENGLRYYIRHNAEPRNRIELRLVVNAGSVLEDRDQRGLAHVVEHMAFNGTRNFAKQELVGYLESVGMRFGPDVNAYTSFDETVYMLTLPTDTAGVLEQGFQILEDWAHGIAFDSLEVEKERSVVIEEWRLGQGAGTRVRDRQVPVLFGGSRYAERLPIGTRESLETFDHAALRRFYRTWYRPDLMAVVAVGDADPDRIEQLLREHFSTIAGAERPRPRSGFTVPPHPETRYSVVTDPEMTGAQVSLYIKRPARQGGTAAAYRAWLTESLASSMLNQRVHELTQQPDAPILDLSTFHGRLLRPLDAFVFSALVPDGRTLGGLEALLAELLRVARHGFTAAELEREKAELLRIMQQRYEERGKTTSSEFAGRYVSHFLYGGALADAETEWALYRELIPGVTLEDAAAVVRLWGERSDRVVLVSAPAGPDQVVPTKAELAAVVENIEASITTAYADGASDLPLLATPPSPGRIVGEEHDAELGITEWTLSNGARVVLKQTDFREDEILFAARSPGGTSRFADEDYIAALTAVAVVQAGGIGDLSLSELRKRLAGQVAGVGAEIGELHEGLSGAASARDLETLFQLVYLRFTAPRVDSTAFLAYRSQARERLRSRNLSPDAAFRDTLQVALTQGHPRARPPSIALFDSLDLWRSYEIYRDRFSDAGDFTFYFVGSVQPDSVRTLAQTYLASLPSTGRSEDWKDVGIRPPPGVVHKTVRRGADEKARTQIVFHGPMHFDRDELTVLNALAEVLQLRLREVLREDLGGTYGVGVQSYGMRDPAPQYRVAIGFGTAPERLDELVTVLFTEIASLKRDGPRAAELSRVREMQKRVAEVRLRENSHWLGQLLAYDRYGWDREEITRQAERAERLTLEQLREAAARYLNPESFVQVSLLPETAPMPGSGAAASEP